MPELRRLPIAALLLVAACSDRPAEAPPAPPAVPSAATDPDFRSVPFAPALGIDLRAMQIKPSGVWYRDLTEGTGTPVGKGSTVSIRYVGQLVDGTRFDDTEAPKSPMTFTLFSGQVVPGFDEAVSGMKVGGKRQVLIPPSLGYGAAGNGPVPPKAVMVFSIELLNVQ